MYSLVKSKGTKLFEHRPAVLPDGNCPGYCGSKNHKERFHRVVTTKRTSMEDRGNIRKDGVQVLMVHDNKGTLMGV